MLKLEDVRCYLPEIMQEIAEIIGMENLELFLKNFGGVCFRFSNGKVYFPELENALGAKLAEKLQRHFSGEER